jgi:hypothetical protein
MELMKKLFKGGGLMKKLLTIFAVAVLISFVCDQQKSLFADSPPPLEDPNPINANTFDANGDLCLIGDNNTSDQELGTPMELWLGVGVSNGTLVGYATFDSINNKVIINLTDADDDGTPDMFPYVLTKVHIHFAETVDGIPHNKQWNPTLGKFEYKIVFEEFDYTVDVYDPSQSVVEVPVVFNAVGAIHLHAEQPGGLEALEYYLPTNTVQMKVKYPQSGDPSYLGMTLDNASQMNGEYESWCGDVDNFIEQDEWYDSQIYSLHDLDLPTGLFENPENLDKVNYLINTFYVGMEVAPLKTDCTPALSCAGDKPPEALTYGDIQVAIWTLIEDTLPDNLSDFAALAIWSQERVNAILCDVNDNGDEFIPTCDDETPLLTAFIVVPDDGTQVQISLIELPCETTEGSAWGDGFFGETFPGENWGTYFLYDETCGL